MNELALFAGAGGGILGGALLGWRTVCAVEIEPYAASVLIARQNDGLLPPFPVWDDVCAFDGRPWRGIIDVISGGFPCQDISAAGKGAGITGERSGLWREFARIIGEVRPRFVLVENSPVLTSRGLGTVLGDLAAMGYNAEWGVLGAADAGAPHKRDRIWIVARAIGQQHESAPHAKQRPISQELPVHAIGITVNARRTESAGQLRTPRITHGGDDVANPNEVGRDGRSGKLRQERREQFTDGGKDDCHSDRPRLEKREGKPGNDGTEQPATIGTDWWAVEPEVGRVAHGVAARVDRLKALGNGQVPAVVRLAWETLI